MASVGSERAAAATRRDLDRADPRAYIRIAAVLRERITTGELAPGQATPSITGLCADHGVARQTAAHALHVLKDAGLVYQVPGLGYHIRTDILSRLRAPGGQLPLLLCDSCHRPASAASPGRSRWRSPWGQPVAGW